MMEIDGEVEGSRLVSMVLAELCLLVCLIFISFCVLYLDVRCGARGCETDLGSSTVILW